MSQTPFKKLLNKSLGLFNALCVLAIVTLFIISYIMITSTNIAIVANSLRLGGFLDFKFGIEFLFALYGSVWAPLFLLILANKWIK